MYVQMCKLGPLGDAHYVVLLVRVVSAVNEASQLSLSFNYAAAITT